jgi:hypothetical protein
MQEQVRCIELQYLAQPKCSFASTKPRAQSGPRERERVCERVRERESEKDVFGPRQ